MRSGLKQTVKFWDQQSSARTGNGGNFRRYFTPVDPLDHVHRRRRRLSGHKSGTSQRRHWVDSRGFSRRDVTGQNRDESQEERSRNESQWINRTDSEKQTRNDPRRKNCCDNSGAHPNQDKLRSVTKHEFENIARLRAERDTDANLLLSL